MLIHSATDSAKRTRVLRQLVTEQMYVVDASIVADAILTRAGAKLFVPDAPFRNEQPSTQEIRSFRLEHEARSFRISSRRRELTH